jgi:hypothetical protein
MDVYHPVQPNITDPNLKPHGSRISSVFMPTNGGFIQNHYIAIIIAVVVLIILLVIFYVYLTRQTDKKKDESSDNVNEIDNQELERLRNLRKRTRGEPQILQRHVMHYDDLQPEPQPVQPGQPTQQLYQPIPLKHDPLKHDPLKHEPLKHEPLKHEPLKHEPLKQPVTSDKTTYDLDAFINSLSETSN